MIKPTAPDAVPSCGQGNCKILNPVRPDLWCHACLRTEVETLRAALRRGTRYDQYGRPLLPGD